MLFNFFVVLIALVLDYKFSEMRRFHPLVGFGNLAIKAEGKLNLSSLHVSALKENVKPAWQSKCLGIFAWCLVIVPIVYMSFIIEQYLVADQSHFSYALFIYSTLAVYLAIGWRSLISHAQVITKPLKKGDIKAARLALSMIVSRDTQALSETQISNAATESVLENGADAIFSAIFWFVILGVPGVVLYRLANTLDAMWGYKNNRFLYFGWFAARIDDLLNLIPARLCALSYVLLGNSKLAWQCWRKQGVNWKSPNAGPVMASGAGAINVKLGGGSMYHGAYQDRPVLGPLEGCAPSHTSIDAACLLVDRVLILWVFSLLLMAIVIGK